MQVARWLQDASVRVEKQGLAKRSAVKALRFCVFTLRIVEVALLPIQPRNRQVAANALVLGRRQSDVVVVLFQRIAITSQLKVKVSEVNDGDVEVRFAANRFEVCGERIVITSYALVSRRE